MKPLSNWCDNAYKAGLHKSSKNPQKTGWFYITVFTIENNNTSRYKEIIQAVYTISRAVLWLATQLYVSMFNAITMCYYNSKYSWLLGL